MSTVLQKKYENTMLVHGLVNKKIVRNELKNSDINCEHFGLVFHIFSFFML